MMCHFTEEIKWYHQGPGIASEKHYTDTKKNKSVITIAPLPHHINYDSSYRITVSTSEVSTSSCSSGSLRSSSLKHFLYVKVKNLLINGQNFSLLSHLKIFRMTCPPTGYRGIAGIAMAYQVWHERNLGVKAKNIYYESYLWIRFVPPIPSLFVEVGLHMFYDSVFIKSYFWHTTLGSNFRGKTCQLCFCLGIIELWYNSLPSSWC